MRGNRHKHKRKGTRRRKEIKLPVQRDAADTWLHAGPKRRDPFFTERCEEQAKHEGDHWLYYRYLGRNSAMPEGMATRGAVEVG